MFKVVLNKPVFRLHLVMFCVIIATSDGIFWILKWLEDNLCSFKYFKKITLLSCLQKARRSKDSSPLYLLIRYNTHAPWKTISTIQTNQNHNHFFIRIPILGHVLVHSVDKSHFLVVKWNWIGCCSWKYFSQLCSNTKQIS